MSSPYAAEMKDDNGQTLSEFGLILALVGVIAMGALTFLGGYVSATLGNVASTF